jgi:uncharacterized membrane protein
MIRSSMWVAATATLAAAMVMGASAPAHAWYKVTNKTPNTVWVSHAVASTSGILCGWNDGCDDNSTKGWRVHGWWQISPGGTAIVQTQNFGNAVHQIFAHDAFGHTWGQNGGAFGTPNAVFSRCEGLFTDLNLPYLTYRKIRTSWCCGGACPADGTSNLTL